MPLTVRNSAQRRRKKPDEKLPERPGESTASAQVMAPTRMKLRVRRRDSAAAAAARGGGPLEEEEEGRRESSSHSSRRKNSTKTSSSAAAASSSAPTSSASASVRAVMAAEDASPDSKCPICLDRFNNLAYLDRCLHRFCFPCIQEWSHNKAECPLCKQPFASILHSVRAEDDFKEYTLRPAPANSSVAATVAMVAAMASAARSDQMRLMLRRHRVADGGETLTRRRRRERTGRGEGGRNAEDLSEDSEEEEDIEQRRAGGGADPSERGVIFETGLAGAAAPVAPNDRASRRLMARLAARQRQQREGGAVRRLRERETVAFRRTLYRCGIRVRGVAGVNGNPGQQQRDITAESFCRNPTLLNRLRPWLRRELTVLYGAHGSLVDIVQRIIVARLTRHGLEDTSTIEGELRQFLLARTEHFVHELVNFARSPLSMDTYDQQAVYEPPAAALELDGVSSSSDSSSVIAISEGEEEEQRRTGVRSEERVGGVGDDVIQTGSCLSLSGWDDETPGPSYSTAEQSCSLAPLSISPAPQQPAASEDRGEKQEEEGEEECLIVGYKKPIAERTPELVQLSSDTEEEAEETEKVSPLPSTAAAHPLLPTIPPSTSGSFREEQEDKQKEEVLKDGQQQSRARSWSGSSGRSRSSVCMLSPPTPGEGAQRRERGSWRHRKQSASEGVSERRRRKRRRRERERSSDRLRKSGTLYNPNRSIYPAMMLRRSHSSSPFHSSTESGSPEPPSPTDSSWEYHCSQVSPLTSSVSSPSRSSSSSRLSSSPLPSSPQPQTPPTPSLSPSSKAHHGEKPGGKRKYKSRHLDSDKDPTWRPSSSNKEKRREKRRRGRDGGRRRERQRRETSSHGGESSRKSREDRSPSVEIIYEGTITAQPPAHKRRRRRHRKPQQHSSSPVIITLDSDNDDNNKNSNSSSPLSSQQTVDFSDLPPLPLVHSAGMGGALDAEIGELPVDILDRESDGSETEPAGQSAAAVGPIAIDNSDAEVDVENDEAPPPSMHRPESGAAPLTAGQSDSALLAAVLLDLKGVCPPKPDLSLNHEDSGQDGCSAETRQASAALPDVRDQLSGRVSVRSPPPLERRQECCDVPALLAQACPVRSHSRNTPPPLKHRDAGSPRQLLVSPADSTAVSCPQIVPLKSCSEATPPTVTEHGSSSAVRGEQPAGVPSDHSVDYNHSAASQLHSSPADLPPAPPSAPADPHSVDPHWSSAVLDRSKERTAHTDCPSGGCRNQTVSSPSSLAAAGGGVFSGVRSNHMLSPISVSSFDSRTQTPFSPTDPSGRSSPVHPHPGSPRTVDLHFSSAAAEELTGRKTLSGEERWSAGPPPPASVSTMTDGHLNHTALSPPPSEHTLNFHTSKPSTDLHPTLHAPPQSECDPPPKRSERDLHLHTDNHITSSETAEKRCSSQSSIDGHSHCQPAAGERSHGWNTHTHSSM